MLSNSYHERVEVVSIEQLVGTEMNPRDIQKRDFQQLLKDIQADPDFFIGKPILAIQDHATGKKVVYAGNQRLQACKRLGYKEVNCCVAEALPEPVMRKRALLDNHHHGTWNYDRLADTYAIEELEAMGGKFMSDLKIPEKTAFEGLLEEAGKLLQDASTASPTPKAPGAAIKTEIVFENETQKLIWQKFLTYLQDVHEEVETPAARLCEHAANVLDNAPIFVRLSLLATLYGSDATVMERLDAFIQGEINQK